MDALIAMLEDEGLARPPFAPPFLKDGERVIGQTAAILFYLAARLGLAPKEEAGRLWVHQIQLTIADAVSEAHDTHHPISGELYYEDQKAEALRRAEAFRRGRMPKYLAWFEAILARDDRFGHHLVGRRITYADLSLFQLIEGLSYAFPRSMKEALKKAPRVAALRDAVAERPRVRTYLASDRRIPFNESGIFRHYSELDG